MHLKKLMTGVMVFFLLGCFLCACGKTKDQTRKIIKDTNKKIIIGGDNYPPFNYTDENGNPAGIDVELAKEAFSRMGYKPVFVNIDWENKKNLVEQGKIDCIWACFSVTGRENDYHNSSKIYKLSDLKNKVIAVQSTTKPEELFLKQTDPKIPKVKQVYSMENRELIYTSLGKGYVDAIAAHEISIRQYMSDYEAKYRILDEDILETGIGVAFAKNDQRGIEKELSKTLKAMVKDGSAKKILKKYISDAEKYLEVSSLEK